MIMSRRQAIDLLLYFPENLENIPHFPKNKQLKSLVVFFGNIYICLHLHTSARF